MIKIDSQLLEDIVTPRDMKISSLASTAESTGERLTVPNIGGMFHTIERGSQQFKRKAPPEPPPKKPKKKVRFDDNVVIHKIEARASSPQAMPETYKLVIQLREVYDALDRNGDGFLNEDELTILCQAVWEEPDEDVKKILDDYAKEDPTKGINFNEWCTLIRDEDPSLKELVDDLYEIFCNDSSSEEEESESEKAGFGSARDLILNANTSFLSLSPKMLASVAEERGFGPKLLASVAEFKVSA